MRPAIREDGVKQKREGKEGGEGEGGRGCDINMVSNN